MSTVDTCNSKFALMYPAAPLAVCQIYLIIAWISIPHDIILRLQLLMYSLSVPVVSLVFGQGQQYSYSMNTPGDRRRNRRRNRLPRLCQVEPFSVLRQ